MHHTGMNLTTTKNDETGVRERVESNGHGRWDLTPISQFLRRLWQGQAGSAMQCDGDEFSLPELAYTSYKVIEIAVLTQFKLLVP